MSIETTTTSEVKVPVERGNEQPGITAGDIRDWVSTLPDEATLSTITVDIGNQRDPWHVLVGLRGTWKAQS